MTLKEKTRRLIWTTTRMPNRNPTPDHERYVITKGDKCWMLHNRATACTEFTASYKYQRDSYDSYMAVYRHKIALT